MYDTVRYCRPGTVLCRVSNIIKPKWKSQKIEVKPVVDLDEYNVTDFGNVRYYAPKVTIPQKAGSGNVTITFNMQYDHEQFSCGNPSRLILLNENLIFVLDIFKTPYTYLSINLHIMRFSLLCYLMA